jgi:uncharacterized protein
MNKTFCKASVLISVVLVGYLAMGYARSIMHDRPLSVQALPSPLMPVTVNPDWIKSGKPVFKLAQTARIPSANVTTGLWSCDGPTEFEWTFASDETVHIIEGEVEIDYLGKKMTLRVGDTAFFHANTQATWVVQKRVLKSYTLHDPNRLVRWYRKVMS